MNAIGLVPVNLGDSIIGEAERLMGLPVTTGVLARDVERLPGSDLAMPLRMSICLARAMVWSMPVRTREGMRWYIMSMR